MHKTYQFRHYGMFSSSICVQSSTQDLDSDYSCRLSLLTCTLTRTFTIQRMRKVLKTIAEQWTSSPRCSGNEHRDRKRNKVLGCTAKCIDLKKSKQIRVCERKAGMVKNGGKLFVTPINSYYTQSIT